jgi:hypothetical protein
MQFFFIYAALLVLPFVAFAEQLRKEKDVTPYSMSKIRASKNLMSTAKIGTQTIVGSFPTTPKYVSVLFYDDQECTGELNSVGIRMTDTCLTDGVTSEMWKCGKISFLFFFLF